MSILLLSVADSGGVAILSTSAHSPATGSDNAGSGTLTWLNPDRIVSSNNSRATSTFSTPDSSATTHRLIGTDFNFTLGEVPADAEISAILVEVEISDTSAEPPVNQTVVSSMQLVIGGSVQAPNVADDEVFGGTDAYRAFIFSGSDLSGLTSAQLRASNFGVSMQAEITTGGDSQADVARVDHMRVTAYYYIPEGPRFSGPPSEGSLALMRAGR